MRMENLRVGGSIPSLAMEAGQNLDRSGVTGRGGELAGLLRARWHLGVVCAAVIINGHCDPSAFGW